MTRQVFLTEVILPVCCSCLWLNYATSPSNRNYFLRNIAYFLKNNTTNPSNRSNFPHRFCFQNDTASPFSNRIYTSCIASVSKMTRQILQTGATSRIASAFKMTRRLRFQTEFILPALLPSAKWYDKSFKQEQLPASLQFSLLLGGEDDAVDRRKIVL